MQKWLFLGALAVITFWTITLASANDKFAAPDMQLYYESLRMPDSLASCCGEADAYYADKTDSCTPKELAFEKNCALVAIITDTRSDDRKLPNGYEIHRKHIPVGTRIIVRQSKIRKHYEPNPTDHNIIFENDAWFPLALCWEPQTGL